MHAVHEPLFLVIAHHEPIRNGKCAEREAGDTEQHGERALGAIVATGRGKDEQRGRYVGMGLLKSPGGWIWSETGAWGLDVSLEPHIGCVVYTTEPQDRALSAAFGLVLVWSVIPLFFGGRPRKRG